MLLKTQREAFSMITAIFVIVLMASVAAFIMNLSGKMVQETTTQYHREQAVLLAKSYTEFAIMAVTANEHNTSNCLDNISGSFGTGGFYSVDVNISYIGSSRDVGVLSSSGCNKILASDIKSETAPLSIILDVFVKYKDQDHPLGASAPDITYHRRSLQKI